MPTVDQLVFALTLAAALGCGLVAGVFFAFSTFVMKALVRRPAAEGIAAMQAINVVVLNPWFLGVFVGTAALSVAAVAFSLLQWQDRRAALWLAGGVLYAFGTFGVTVRFNVPRNDALAGVAPDAPDAAGRWADYVSGWTAWNHARTAAALAAAAAFSLALR